MRNRLLFTAAIIFLMLYNLHSQTNTEWGYKLDSIYWEYIGDDFNLEYSPENASVGEIPMQAEVNKYGAAIINVPLELPDIGNCLKPDLALNYNSMQPSTMFGNEWALSGLSEICRVNKSIYYDGIMKSMKKDEEIDGSEAFTINGNRLIVTNNSFPEHVIYLSETGNIKVKASFVQRQDSLTENKLRNTAGLISPDKKRRQMFRPHRPMPAT